MEGVLAPHRQASPSRAAAVSSVICHVQVLEAEPECAIVSEDPKPEVYGVDEPISEDEAEDDGRIGYEDIGGLGKVSSISVEYSSMAP